MELDSVSTYSHLRQLGRAPTPYETASTDLLYYLKQGVEVPTPSSRWVLEHQKNVVLPHGDLGVFCDPRETTYTRYVDRQREQTLFVENIFLRLAADGSDLRHSPEWSARLEDVLCGLRYPLHALQMTAGFIGQIVPSSTLAITFAMQAMDEMRWIQMLAYRLKQLQLARPGFGATPSKAWQHDPHWQPLRRCAEELLTVYDWTESFVALNLVVKPWLREIFLTQMSVSASQHGDAAFGEIAASLLEDQKWHDETSAELVRLLVGFDPANEQRIATLKAKWAPKLNYHWEMRQKSSSSVV